MQCKVFARLHEGRLRGGVRNMHEQVQPLETRSAGQSITTLVNLLFSFVIGQVLYACISPGMLRLDIPHAHRICAS